MKNKNFNFETKIQMRWKDLDALGHVNNANYLTYFEVARSFYIMAACPEWNWQNDMFLIANVNVNFHNELKLTDQNVSVCVRTSKIGSKSFVLDYEITSKNGDNRVIHASGTTTQIMFDMKERASMIIPEWVKNSLISYDQLSE